MMTLEDRAWTQNDQVRFENWSAVSQLKFNDKCKVLTMRLNNCICKYKLGND